MSATVHSHGSETAKAISWHVIDIQRLLPSTFLFLAYYIQLIFIYCRICESYGCSETIGDLHFKSTEKPKQNYK